MIIKILHLYSNTLYPGHSLNKLPGVKILFVKDDTKSTYSCQAINKKYKKNIKSFKNNKLRYNSTSKIAANCHEKAKILKNINFFQSHSYKKFQTIHKRVGFLLQPIPQPDHFSCSLNFSKLLRS